MGNKTKEEWYQAKSRMNDLGELWLSLLGEIAGEKKVGKLNDLGELYKLSLLGEIGGEEKVG